MKRSIILFFVLGSLQFGRAQSSHDILVGASQDLLKTDLSRLFNKAQFGLEGNYFIVRHFAVGAGAEIWTPRYNSFVMGVRWYADEKIFVRFRGLIGANDAALGAGWSQPLNKVWRLEGIGDYYFRGNFAIRAGICYVIRRD